MPARIARSATPSPHPTGRRARKRAETRERLFRAALRLFAERGYTATTVEDITEAADVGKGTFFNYFPSKEHIFGAFGEMQVSKVAAVVTAPGAAQRPVREVLHAMVMALAEEPGKSPALVRALMTANLTNGAVRELMLHNLGRARQLLSRFFAQAQKRGTVRRDLNVQDLAAGMQRVFFGTMFMWALDPREPLQKRHEKSLALFWHAIAARGRE